MSSNQPGADPPLHPPAEILSTYTLLTLMQHMETHQQDLSSEAVIALYEDWLRLVGGAESYMARFNLGTLHQRSGRPEAAAAQYRAVLSQFDLPEARHNLGLLLEKSGRLEEAMEQWRRLLSKVTSGSPLYGMAIHAMIRVSRRLGSGRSLQRYIALSLELDPDQPALIRELGQLSEGQGKPAHQPDGATPAVPGPGGPEVVRPSICVIAVCFNEATILPFFLDHYINFIGATKVILYDGGSTDATAAIAGSFPQVELIVSPSEKLDDRDLMRIRNEAWKVQRDQFDWMVVCDVDEFLYHPEIRALLLEFKGQRVTLPMVEGFEMLSKTQPEYRQGHFIWQDIQTGVPNPQYYNKNLIFDPKIDINYKLGCHACEPTGPVKRSEGFVFKNLHYRMLSYGHFVAKSRRAAARLSDWNKETNAGFHYRLNAEMSQADYNKMFQTAYNVVHPRLRPTLQREAFDAVLQRLVAMDRDACILEYGTTRGFGAAADCGSTELFAWYVHSFGGRFCSVATDPLIQRHAARELDRRRLMGSRLQLVDAAGSPGSAFGAAAINLLLMNSSDYMGDDRDLAQAEREALNTFLDVESRLSSDALIVLDGVKDDPEDLGKFQLLVPYLIGRRYQALQEGCTAAYAKVNNRDNP